MWANVSDGGPHILEQAQHFLMLVSRIDRLMTSRTYIVRGIIRDEESQIGIVEDRSNSDQACSATWYDGDVLPTKASILSLVSL